MTAKEYYNQLARDVAFSGNILFRARGTITLYPATYGIQNYQYVTVPCGTILLTMKCPSPAGAHKKGSGRFFFFLHNGAIMYWSPHHIDAISAWLEKL